MLDRPIFVIGAARSGTTLVAHAVASHPEVAFWEEPKYVWRHGNPRAAHDYRSPEEATARVSAYIREAFSRYTRKHAKARFLEKTPSNCFRVGFIDRIFPQGLFIHLVRDGCDTAASALRRWRSAPDDSAIWRRLRNFEIPLGEMISYAPDVAREALWRRLAPQRGHIWGPRYPGIRQDVGRLDTAAVCALQWVKSEQAARADLERIAPSRVFALRYEVFVEDPRTALIEIFQFAGLDARCLPPGATVVPGGPALPEQGDRASAPVTHEDRETIARICLPYMRDAGIGTAEQVRARRLPGALHYS